MAGTSLTGQTKASTYDALLKITDNGPVGGTEKVVTDGLGNDTALKVGTDGVSSTGTLTSLGKAFVGGTTDHTGTLNLSHTGGDSVPAAVFRNTGAGTQRGLYVFVDNSTGVVQLAATGADPGSVAIASGTTTIGTFSDTGLAVTGGLSATTGINSTTIGGTTPAAGAFTTLSASSGINSTNVGAGTPGTGAFTTLTAPFVKQSGGNKRLEADFVKTADTATATITGLSVDVAAGETYSFEANLFCLQSGSGGYVVGIGGTATATAFYGGITWFTGAASVINDSLPNFPGGSSTSTSATAYRVCANGTITVNAGGTLTVYFAQASATGSSTVKRGSYLHVTQY